MTNADRNMKTAPKGYGRFLTMYILDVLVFIGISVWAYTIHGCKWDLIFIILAVAVFAVTSVVVFRRERKLRNGRA